MQDLDKSYLIIFFSLILALNKATWSNSNCVSYFVNISLYESNLDLVQSAVWAAFKRSSNGVFKSKVIWRLHLKYVVFHLCRDVPVFDNNGNRLFSWFGNSDFKCILRSSVWNYGHVLCISTSEGVLHTRFAVQNKIFQHLTFVSIKIKKKRRWKHTRYIQIH